MFNGTVGWCWDWRLLRSSHYDGGPGWDFSDASFLILAPTSSFLPIKQEAAAEQRMYLPLAAVVSLVVVGGWLILSRWRGIALGGGNGGLRGDSDTRPADDGTKRSVFQSCGHLDGHGHQAS